MCAIIECERARTDRTDDDFSIVIFFEENLPGDANKIRILLLENLVRRVRLCDSVGWLNRRIAIVLPETSKAAAETLAGQVVEALCGSRVKEAYRVCTYPFDWFPYDKGCYRHTQQHGNVLERDENIRMQSPVDKLRGGQAGRLRESESFKRDYIPHRLPRWKRSVDLIGAVLGLTFLFPLMVTVAAMIKVVSTGPVFFRQERIGFRGSRFVCWKFRTMHVDADPEAHARYVSKLMKTGAPMTKMDSQDDPRIIPLGKWIRQTGIDELPQLVNVLRGEMSLVGPRPCLSNEAGEYSLWHKRRFDTLPGLTGLWQVEGKNQTTFEEMLRMDITYTRRMSFLLDVQIVAKTLPAIARYMTNRRVAHTAEEL